MQQCNYRVDNENFIDFSGLADLSGYDFYLIWHLSDGTQNTLQWSQAEYPLSKTDENMNPQGATLSSGGSALNFIGLSISSSTDTLLDGTDAGKAYSIGYNYNWRDGLNQAYIMPDGTVTAATKTELMLFTDATGIFFCIL